MKHKKNELSEVPEQTPPKKAGKFRLLLMKIGKRNAIIACTVILIGLAVFLNWMLFAGGNQDGGYDGYEEVGGKPQGDSTQGGTQQEADNSYFSATQVSRQKARDEALEVLQSVVDNVDADEAVKAEALAGISAIADEIRKESDIESLVTAKGFERCVAVLNGDTVSVVVDADTLQASDIAQINEIVYSQTGISPSGVTIINK